MPGWEKKSTKTDHGDLDPTCDTSAYQNRQNSSEDQKSEAQDRYSTRSSGLFSPLFIVITLFESDACIIIGFHV